MSDPRDKFQKQIELRSRATSLLNARGGSGDAHMSASAALGVLHGLASSPETAAEALALLHELQVHQLELDLQHEELLRSSGELEGDIHRQLQLYDFAPVGLFTVDSGTTLFELNLTGAQLLGAERNALLGRPLAGYLVPRSGEALKSLLERFSAGPGRQVCALELAPGDGGPRSVRASVVADPAGGRFLVAFDCSPA